MDTILVDRKKYLLMCVEILKNHAHKDLQVYVESEIFRLSNGDDKWIVFTVRINILKMNL